MAPLQDLLNLGREARMNVPGRTEVNWRRRCTEDMLNGPTFKWVRDLPKSSNRFGAMGTPNREKVLEVVSQ